MTKNEFFNIIIDGLKDFPEATLQDIIAYYQNRFYLGESIGKTESEIISELGDPNLIINQCRNNYIQNDTFSTPLNDVNSNNTLILPKLDQSNASNSNNNFTDNNNINYNHFSSGDYNTNNNYNNTNNSYNSNSDFSKSHKYTNSAKNYTKFKLNSNLILKIGIFILALIIFSPILTGIIGFIIGMFGLAIGLFCGSIGLLIGGTFTNCIGLPNVPLFISDFPFPSIVLFSLATITLSILLIILFYYFCKWIFRIAITIFNKFKSQEGGF